jgi:hypothetical protein
VQDSQDAKTNNRRLAARVRLFGIRAKNNWIFVAVGLIAGFLIFSGTTLKAITDIYGFFSPNLDALSLAREGIRDQVSRDFVETAARRLYLSRNFLARIQRRAPSNEIHDAWTRLTNTVEHMASKTLVYSNSFEVFYGTPRRSEFEDGIQSDFNLITVSLVNLRYSAAIKKLEFPDVTAALLTDAEEDHIRIEAAQIMKRLDELNIRIYHFTTCFDKKQQTAAACKS